MPRTDLWGPEDIEELKKMYNDPHCTVGFMAESLGRTENSIRLKASRIGLNRPALMYFPDDSVQGVYFDPLTRTLTIMRPVEIDQVLKVIKKIKRDWNL